MSFSEIEIIAAPSSTEGALRYPRTGVAGFDRTGFRLATPRASHVVKNYLGAGLLLQHGEGVPDDAEIIAPAMPFLHVLARRRLSPRVRSRVGDVSHQGPQEPGAFVLIPQETESHWVTDAETLDQGVHVFIDPGVAEDIVVEETGRAPAGYAPLFARPDAAVAAATEAMLKEAAAPGGPNPLGWRSALTALVVRLAAVGAGAPRRRAAKGGLAPWQAARTLGHMRDNLARPVTLEELSSLARVSPFHFCRAFRETVGEPPHRRLMRMRLDEARRLLRQSSQPVDAIAAAVGYDSAHSLSRLFRQRYGVTPAAYRTVMRR